MLEMSKYEEYVAAQIAKQEAEKAAVVKAAKAFQAAGWMK